MSIRDSWNRLQELVHNEYGGCLALERALNDVAGDIAAEFLTRAVPPTVVLAPAELAGGTPRTDAEEYDAIANTNSALLANDKQYVVAATFPRQLERELALSQAELRGSRRIVEELKGELQLVEKLASDQFYRRVKLGAQREAQAARIKELEGALTETVEWLDSQPVRDSLSRAAQLTLTHPHLGVKVDPQFSANAAAMWKRIRALAQSTGKEGG